MIAALLAALLLAPSALAVGDPVASGKLTVQLSASFKKKLKRGGVSMTPKSFSIKEGAIDPISGTGSISLPDIRFKRGSRKHTFKQVTATLGPGGAIAAKGVTLFRLSGGSPVRDGFGAAVSGLSAKLTRSAAKMLGRKLGVERLPKGAAGQATVAYQPREVQVAGGTVTLAAHGPGIAGSVGSKLTAHCINIASSAGQVGPLAPATSDGHNPPTFTLPVTGGTISPDGGIGSLSIGGGISFRNNSNGVCAGMPQRRIDQTDFLFDVGAKNAKARVVIGGMTSQPMGDQGSVFTSFLDTSGLVTTANPANRTLTANGADLQINGGTALVLNQVFPQPWSNFSLAKQFTARDRLGAVRVSLTTR